MIEIEVEMDSDVLVAEEVSNVVRVTVVETPLSCFDLHILLNQVIFYFFIFLRKAFLNRYNKSWTLKILKRHVFFTWKPIYLVPLILIYVSWYPLTSVILCQSCGF